MILPHVLKFCQNNKLTFINIILHDLTATRLETNGQTGTVGFQVAIQAVVPGNAGDVDGPTHSRQTVDIQLGLKCQQRIVSTLRFYIDYYMFKTIFILNENKMMQK